MRGLAALGAELRARIGPPPAARDWPLVSIVVVSRDGVEHLRRLIAGLVDRTDYPHVELIVVDNGSLDGSVELLRDVPAPFPISIVANPYNESFSGANEQGAAVASGDLLLFLNNDVEPFESGWLRELVSCRRTTGAGAVGATLVCDQAEHRTTFSHGYGVQHRGLGFEYEAGTLVPALHGWADDPLDARLGEDVVRPAVAAACLLVERDLYRDVGGFGREYVYGCEDVDLCLKVRAAGRAVICSGRAVLLHHPASTRRTIDFEQAVATKRANRRLLWEAWGPRLRRECELDALAGGGAWIERGTGADALASREEILAPGLCVHSADPSPTAAVRAARQALAEHARAGGQSLLTLSGEDVDDPRGLMYDVAVHVRGAGRAIPAPGRLNVLWTVDGHGPPAALERSRYDLVIGGDASPSAVVAAALDALAAGRYPTRIDPDEATE